MPNDTHQPVAGTGLPLEEPRPATRLHVMVMRDLRTTGERFADDDLKHAIDFNERTRTDDLAEVAKWKRSCFVLLKAFKDGPLITHVEYEGEHVSVSDVLSEVRRWFNA